MKCSQCGTPARTQEDKFCIACGHPFVTTDSSEPPDAGPAAPRDGWVCPRCGHAGQAGDRFCLQCGAPAPAPLPQCPLCGATAHSREDRFCLQCGASLTPDGPGLSSSASLPENVPPVPAPAAEPPAPGTPDLFSPAPLPEDAPPAPALAAGPLAPGTPDLFSPAPLPEDASPAPAPAAEPPAPGTPDLFSSAPLPEDAPPAPAPAAQPPAPGTPDLFSPAPLPEDAPPAPALAAGPLAPGTPDLFSSAPLPEDAPPAPAPAAEPPASGTPGLFSSAPLPEDAPPAPGTPDLFSSAPLPEDAPPAPALAAGPLAPGTPDLFSPAPLPEDASPAPAPAAEPPAPGTPDLFSSAPPPEDAPPAPAPAKPAKRVPRRAKGYHVLIASAIALLLALLVAYGLLYFWNQPQPAIDRLVNGLAKGNLAVVRGSILLQDVEESDVSWDAFMAAFQTTEAQNRLKAQLQLQAANPEVTGLSYPAISMTSEPILPGIRRYLIAVQGVSVSVPPQAAPAGTIALNGTAFTAAQEGANCTLKNLMPGLYSATFTDASGASSTVEVELFSDKALSLEETGLAVQQGYTLVLEGVGEGVSVMVNGALRPQTPQNGAVTLPDVPLGSEITLVGFYADTGGDLSFVFNDPAATRYSFGQGQAAEPPPSAPEDPLVAAQTASLQTLEANLQTFYRSYLECLNQESLSPLLMSTEANSAIVAERMGRPGNQANRFEFSSAALESGSLTPSVLDGLPCVTFNASFAYRYAPREGGEPAAGSNRQTVQMVLQDGEWRVNNFTMVSDGDYDNHVLASFD